MEFIIDQIFLYYFQLSCTFPKWYLTYSRVVDVKSYYHVISPTKFCMIRTDYIILPYIMKNYDRINHEVSWIYFNLWIFILQQFYNARIWVSSRNILLCLFSQQENIVRIHLKFILPPRITVLLECYCFQVPRQILNAQQKQSLRAT